MRSSAPPPSPDERRERGVTKPLAGRLAVRRRTRSSASSLASLYAAAGRPGQVQDLTRTDLPARESAPGCHDGRLRSLVVSVFECKPASLARAAITLLSVLAFALPSSVRAAAGASITVTPPTPVVSQSFRVVITNVGDLSGRSIDATIKRSVGICGRSSFFDGGAQVPFDAPPMMSGPGVFSLTSSPLMETQPGQYVICAYLYNDPHPGDATDYPVTFSSVFNVLSPPATVVPPNPSGPPSSACTSRRAAYAAAIRRLRRAKRLEKRRPSAAQRRAIATARRRAAARRRRTC